SVRDGAFQPRCCDGQHSHGIPRASSS
ncbi:hypothetical protein D047_4123B, partial [Vibrio parahaemolyticus VPTS-2010_2]